MGHWLYKWWHWHLPFSQNPWHWSPLSLQTRKYHKHVHMYITFICLQMPQTLHA